MVRVISHEINNSLTPIASISQTLSKTVNKNRPNEDISDDLTEGLAIIAERANNLGQFVNSYKQLAKLPEPDKKFISILALINKTAALFVERTTVTIKTQRDNQLLIDPVQFEQVLINLLKNAVEAMAQLEADGELEIEWSVSDTIFKLTICDQGAGINNSENLFVPFYSTKKHGSGIGLILCREIVEAHDGHLMLSNRKNVQGCCATVELPHLR